MDSCVWSSLFDTLHDCMFLTNGGSKLPPTFGNSLPNSHTDHRSSNTDLVPLAASASASGANCVCRLYRVRCQQQCRAASADSLAGWQQRRTFSTPCLFMKRVANAPKAGPHFQHVSDSCDGPAVATEAGANELCSTAALSSSTCCPTPVAAACMSETMHRTLTHCVPRQCMGNGTRSP